MNLLNLIPGSLQEKYINNLKKSGSKKDPHKYFSKLVVLSLVFSFVVGGIMHLFGKSIAISLLVSFISIQIIFYLRISMKASSRVTEMEKRFPDFLQLMSSNLRAGMTIEKAFMSSVRPELAPLDKEISETARDVATGKDITVAFKDMAKRIDSYEITNIISLIISGLRTGGNISSLLQTISSNMREKAHLEKKASSNVSMYVIFIFVAVSIGAPLLFGLSSVLVEVILDLTTALPDVGSSQMSMPFTFSGIDISVNFIVYFSVIFIVVTDVISSLLLGLVNKGNEKFGLKYLFPMIALSLGIFFVIRVALSGFIGSMFSSAA